MPRTPVRRQGVIYGPPRPPDNGRDTGSFIGRLLGLGIIVLAMTVLAAGAVAFLNRPTASPRSPSPSPQPSVSITPGATFSPEATATPAGSSSPVPSGSAAPSSSPAPFVPEVHVGPGFVTFGTKLDQNVKITDPRATFTMSDKIRWSAYLTQPANSVDLRVRVLKLDPQAENGERLISEAGVQPRVKGAQRFGRRIDPSQVLDGPGVYVVRYLRGDTIMSEGYFLLQP